MQTKAEIRSAIVDLAGPVSSEVVASTARKTLAWVLGQHGDASLHEVLFGSKPASIYDSPAQTVIPTITPPSPSSG